MFNGTRAKIQENVSDALKPHIEQISTALYMIAGFLVMILLALVTRGN